MYFLINMYAKVCYLIYSSGIDMSVFLSVMSLSIINTT
jgi:hypothetical protein